MASEAEIRARLMPQYLALFQAEGMSHAEAEEAFDDLVEKAKQEGAAKGTSELDATRLLNVAETNPNMRRELEWKAQQGVREEDLQWWWNMPDLERQILLENDKMNVFAQFVALRRSGVEMREAGNRVKITHATFSEFLGDQQDPEDAHGALPVELKARVLKYIERETTKEPTGQVLRMRAAKAGSFNALVRKEIVGGNL